MVSQFKAEINQKPLGFQTFRIVLEPGPHALCDAATVEVRLQFDADGAPIRDPALDRARERWRDAGYEPHSACREAGCVDCDGRGWVWRGRPRPLPIPPWSAPVVDVFSELERRALNLRINAKTT